MIVTITNQSTESNGSMVRLYNGLNKFAAAKLILTPREFADLKLDFQDYFHVGDTEPVEFQRRDIPCDVLLDKVTAINQGSNTVRGIQFHYGMHDTTFLVAIEFLSKNAQNEYVHIGAGWECYMYDETGRRFTQVSKADISTLKLAYLNAVKLKRTAAGGFEQLRPPAAGPNLDPVSTIFPFAEEVDQLLRDNGVTAENAASYKLASSCISATVNLYGAEENRHGLAMHVVERRIIAGVPTYIDRIVDAPVMLPFTNRVADLGNLCPPGCPK